MNPFQPPPLVTLTTDFGYSDHYVGTVKGVILSRCPNACIVDISHGVPAFSLHSGAYAIAQARAFYPPQTIHVVVVDPGVGTSRGIVLLETAGQLFLAPDNGVLTGVFVGEKDTLVRAVTNRDLFLEDVSSTFHGRDVFAAVAGSLASGAAAPSDVGPVKTSLELLPSWQPCQVSAAEWHGIVLSVDHFGNVITNLGRAELSSIPTCAFQLDARNAAVNTFSSTFASAPPGVCFAYFGSSGYLEVGMNQDSAAASLCLKPGDPVTLTLFPQMASASPSRS